MRATLLLCLALLTFAVPAAAQPSGRLTTAELNATSFADSKVGISPVRKLTVYLPPHYSEAGRRFPVLYFLNHFFEDQREPFASHDARALLDRAIEHGVIGDVIVVSADFSTPAGSSWYVNSSATGNWEDFMVRELVPFVDARYRTLASRSSRGIVGDGPGGYGAIRFGMRHPELFGAVYAMQPVGTGRGVQPTHSRPDFDKLARAASVEELGGDPYSRIFTSIYQAFLPNAERPPLYFDPPARRFGGRTVPDTAALKRFHAQFALTALVPEYADNLKSLRGLKFDWGRQDTLADHIHGAQALSNLLAEYGVPHEAEEHAGGFRDRHWGADGRFYSDVLPFFSRHLLFGPPVTLADRVDAAHGRLREAMLANDGAARARLYLPDGRSMPEYQPALYGPGQIAVYYGALAARRRVVDYVPVADEVIDLGGAAAEIGSFRITWRLGDGSTQEERGKYMNVWAIGPGGELRLKADVAGYLRPLSDPSAFFVAMPEARPAERALSAQEQRLAEVLDARNVRNARAVQTYDLEAKLADYAEDAVYMPFADRVLRGLAEIRPYMKVYTDNGRGATFDPVRVWNQGFEDFGAYVLEYAKFQVDWRAGNASGIVKGGGLRLWRRKADGSLEMFRQIGTHDHVE